jgi:hypothetical protein
MPKFWRTMRRCVAKLYALRFLFLIFSIRYLPKMSRAQMAQGGEEIFWSRSFRVRKHSPTDSPGATSTTSTPPAPTPSSAPPGPYPCTSQPRTATLMYFAHYSSMEPTQTAQINMELPWKLLGRTARRVRPICSKNSWRIEIGI